MFQKFALWSAGERARGVSSPPVGGSRNLELTAVPSHPHSNATSTAQEQPAEGLGNPSVHTVADMRSAGEPGEKGLKGVSVTLWESTPADLFCSHGSETWWWRNEHQTIFTCECRGMRE